MNIMSEINKEQIPTSKELTNKQEHLEIGFQKADYPLEEEKVKKANPRKTGRAFQLVKKAAEPHKV